MFFSKKCVLKTLVIVSIIIIALLLYINTTPTNIIAAVIGSIVASIAVSAFYNEELHNAMDKYIKIGMVNYFDNFEDAQDEIRVKISKAKNVDIYVMFADRFFNTSATALTSLLAKKNTRLRYFIYSKSNKFIEAYGIHWQNEHGNSEYNSKGIVSKLDNVVKLISRFNEKKNSTSVIELYEIQSAPVSYSFYRIDNELYFVPSKNISCKEIKPAVFHFKRTKDEATMFSKIEAELDAMISSKEFLKVDL